MTGRRKIILGLVLLTVFGGGVAAPSARAFDPIIAGMMAPVAVRAAEIAMPYAIKGFLTGVKGFIPVANDVVDILKLPVGVVGCTVGAPFGLFKPSSRFLVDGAAAPFKLTWDLVMLPVKFCGIDMP